MVEIVIRRLVSACEHGLRKGEPAYLVATELDLAICQKCADARKKEAAHG